MPFTIGGDWTPSAPARKSAQKPVKVRLIKRGNNLITAILNLGLDPRQLLNLASTLKKRLGSGGAIKDGAIEIQGDKVDEVKKHLLEMDIKSS